MLSEWLVELLLDYRILQPFTSFGPLGQATPSGGSLETLEEQ